MYRDTNSSSGSGTSTKGDEVEIVSRFLAPLCARDETARNIALAAARNTVEGWLGGVGSPNHWDDTGEMEDAETVGGKFKSQDGRYDMSIERSPTKSAPKNVQPPHPQQLLQDTFRTEGFFPQSVTENPVFLEDNSLECSERYPSGSFDCVDGRLGNETSYGTPNERRRYICDVESYRSSHSTSSDEGKGFKIEPQDRCLRFKDSSEIRFGSSSESERKYLGSSSSERLNEVSLEDRPRTKNYVKVKGGKQKQLEDDDLDTDTRIYGKSPKFDENLGANFDRRNLNFRPQGDALSRDRRYYDSGDDVSFDETEVAVRNRDGVVFNTLDGFENENANEIYHRQDDNRAEDIKLKNFEIYEDSLEEGRQRCPRPEQQDYLRKNEERKFSAGQIKRPLSQDEDVSSKSGRVLESPDVTPGDVGRMLNLGNALDGPRQAQANKYLSLVTLHLPVILRLSVNCPFQNVRIKCAEILELVKDRGLPVPVPAFDGPSAFVPTAEVANPFGSVLKLIKTKTRSSGSSLNATRPSPRRWQPRRKANLSKSLERRSIIDTSRDWEGIDPDMTRMLLQEPGWKLERKGSALLLRRDSSHLKTARVCFRCDVEVREFERDEDYMTEAEPEAAASPLAMCASCLAALCVTVILPWLLIGG